MVVVDSSVWIAVDRKASNPETDWLRGATQREIGLTDLILCEVLRGCRSTQHADRLADDLLTVPVLDGGGTAVALDAARCYRVLRMIGITVASTADCMTAAFCLRNGYQLLHRDHDYDAFEKHFGLAVVHPQAGRA